MIMATMKSIVNTLYLHMVLHVVDLGFEQVEDERSIKIWILLYDLYGMKELPCLLEDWIAHLWWTVGRGSALSGLEGVPQFDILQEILLNGYEAVFTYWKICVVKMFNLYSATN